MENNLKLAIREWGDLPGIERVAIDPETQSLYGADTGGATRHIPAALMVNKADCLPAVLRIAQQYRVPVHPISTGRNWGYGSSLPVVDGCVIIDLSGLRGISHFDGELGTVTIEPGVTQGLLAEYLDQQKAQRPDFDFLVPVTGAGPTCSVLSNALERGYGITPYTDHFAAVIDIEAVLPDGRIYRGALAQAGALELGRLFKWQFGPYLTGIFSQSGLAIVTKMTLSLARRPSCIKACIFSLKEDQLLGPAVERVRRLLGTLPGVIGGINLMNQHRTLAMAAPYPRAQLGEDGLIPADVIETLGKQYQVNPWTGLITLYGHKSVVNAAQKIIRRELAGVGSRLLFVSPVFARRLEQIARLIPGAKGQGLQRTTSTLAKSMDLIGGRPNETALPLAYWRHRHPAPGAHRNPARDGCGLLWYPPLVPMRAESVRAYIQMVHEITRRHRMEPLITLTSVSEKVFDSTVPLLFDRDSPSECQDAANCLQELLETGSRLGFFPYRSGIEQMGWMSQHLDPEVRIDRQLKAALDPGLILSPGRPGS